MNKQCSAILLACLLSACGGGDASVVNPPQPVLSDAPPPPTVESMPPVPANAVNLVSSSFSQGGNAMIARVQFTGAPNLTVLGDLNRMWVSAAAAGGSVTVSGGQNFLVFLPGTSTTVTVTGAANTLYLPLGSLIRLTGSGIASTTVQHYAP